MQSLVHAGKLAAQEEYAQRTKDFEVQKRVEESNSQAAARVRMMKARDDMLEQLKRDSLSKLAVMVGTPAYPKLLRNLILQGLIKLQEPVVEVRCRAGDKVPLLFTVILLCSHSVGFLFFCAATAHVFIP
jgi:V-type H+-transporting ATPase subunit E